MRFDFSFPCFPWMQVHALRLQLPMLPMGSFPCFPWMQVSALRLQLHTLVSGSGPCGSEVCICPHTGCSHDPLKSRAIQRDSTQFNHVKLPARHVKLQKAERLGDSNPLSGTNLRRDVRLDVQARRACLDASARTSVEWATAALTEHNLQVRKYVASFYNYILGSRSVP